MKQESTKTLSLVCPSCGGKMELSANGEKAVCPYCGHEMLIDTDEAKFEVTPDIGLSNGDTVTVKAQAPLGWRFDPSEKQFTVEGLTAWVTSTEQLSGDNLNRIHANTERLIREDWEEIVSSSLAQDMTYAPYRMYLFISDENTSYNRNVLYDTYEVKVTREDGSVLTSYEACSYTDLKYRQTVF